MQTTVLLREENNPVRDILLVVLANFIICLSGQIAFPLWFTPVPIVLQNSIVLLTAAFLGTRRGISAVFLFLLQGAMGCPVFANGNGGLLCLLGPRGGYLIGYLLAAFVVGLIVEKKRNMPLALLAGNLTIYLCGASYLATFIGLEKALLLGVLPFILGDLLKMMASLKLLEWMGKRF